jgi:hypothetical protein
VLHLCCASGKDANKVFTRQTQGEEHMILNQGKVAGGLVDELLEVIHKYDETLYMATVIGCLELVKQQLINDATEENT